MAISLADIRDNTMLPPLIAIYGVGGIGKTSIACCAPNPVVIDVGSELGSINVKSLKVRTYADVLETIGMLCNEQHQFESVVIDTLSALEPKLHDYVCATVPNDKKERVTNIEAYGYTKGLKTHAPREWDNFMDGCKALRERGMMVILTAHDGIVRHEEPDLEPYDRHQIHIARDSEPRVHNPCDAVLYLAYKVATVDKAESDKKRGVGTGERILYTTERPAFKAKNKYGLPHAIAVPDDRVSGPRVVWQMIENAIAASAQPAATAS